MSVWLRAAVSANARRRVRGSLVLSMLALACVGCRAPSSGGNVPTARSAAPAEDVASPPASAPSPSEHLFEAARAVDGPTARDAAPAASSTRLGQPTPPEQSVQPRSSGPRGTAGAARSARRDLSVDEERGGHTLDRHVGKTDAELRARLARERQIAAASTYVDLETAETTVAAALEQQARRVHAWRERQGPRPNLALDYDGPSSTSIGRMLRRGARAPVECDDAVVVLRWDTRREDFYVLTSYPERRR